MSKRSQQSATEQSESDTAALTEPSAEKRAESSMGNSSVGVPYDFRNPSGIHEAEMHQLRQFHVQAARYFTSNLSLFLRREVSVTLTDIEGLSYTKFVQTLSDPGHLCLFRFDPLPGVGLLNVNLNLAHTWVDRMLGGEGEPPKEERFLTEVETALLEDALLAILSEWCRPWAEETDLHPDILGHETHPRYAQATAPETVMVAARFSVGDESEKLGFELGLPLTSVLPLFKKRRDRKDRSFLEKQSVGGGWNPVFDEVSVPVSVQWRVLTMSLDELARLAVGDTLELPPEVLEKACVQVSGIPKFKGTLGVEDGRVAVMVNPA